MSFTTFFSPAYKGRIWDFSKVDINAVGQTVNCVDWDRGFNGLNIDDRAIFLTECVLNVFLQLCA